MTSYLVFTFDSLSFPTGPRSQDGQRDHSVSGRLRHWAVGIATAPVRWVKGSGSSPGSGGGALGAGRSRQTSKDPLLGDPVKGGPAAQQGTTSAAATRAAALGLGAAPPGGIAGEAASHRGGDTPLNAGAAPDVPDTICCWSVPYEPFRQYLQPGRYQGGSRVFCWGRMVTGPRLRTLYLTVSITALWIWYFEWVILGCARFFADSGASGVVESVDSVPWQLDTVTASTSRHGHQESDYYVGKSTSTSLVSRLQFLHTLVTAAPPAPKASPHHDVDPLSAPVSWLEGAGDAIASAVSDEETGFASAARTWHADMVAEIDRLVTVLRSTLEGAGAASVHEAGTASQGASVSRAASAGIPRSAVGDEAAHGRGFLERSGLALWLVRRVQSSVGSSHGAVVDASGEGAVSALAVGSDGSRGAAEGSANGGARRSNDVAPLKSIPDDPSIVREADAAAAASDEDEEDVSSFTFYVLTGLQCFVFVSMLFVSLSNPGIVPRRDRIRDGQSILRDLNSKGQAKTRYIQLRGCTFKQKYLRKCALSQERVCRERGVVTSSGSRESGCMCPHWNVCRRFLETLLRQFSFTSATSFGLDCSTGIARRATFTGRRGQSTAPIAIIVSCGSTTTARGWGTASGSSTTGCFLCISTPRAWFCRGRCR